MRNVKCIVKENNQFQIAKPKEFDTLVLIDGSDKFYTEKFHKYKCAVS